MWRTAVDRPDPGPCPRAGPAAVGWLPRRAFTAAEDRCHLMARRDSYEG